MELNSVVFLVLLTASLLLVVKLIRREMEFDTQLNLLAEQSKEPRIGLPTSEYDIYMTIQAAEAIAYGKYPTYHRLVLPEEDTPSGRF